MKRSCLHSLLGLALASMVVSAPAWARPRKLAEEWKPPVFSGELGVLGALGQDSRVNERGRGYVESALSWKPGADTKGFSLRLAGRGWGQIEVTSGVQSQSRQVEIRDSYLSYEMESSRWRLGFQSLSWGETFGFFIADLPNPRDLSDPLLLEIGHIKKPVFMLQTQWFFSGGGLQLFFTPIARHTEFPVTLPRRDFRKVGPDSEYGLRINKLLDFGLDGSFFAIRHHDRSMVVDPSQVWSAGVTASQSLGTEWILRTDQVFTDFRKTTLEAWRGVLGLDWNATENVTLSAQGQRDPLNTGGSLRVMLHGTSGIWEGFDFETFWFRGFEKVENWIQPKLTYTTRSNFSISARYDWLDGSVLDSGLLAGLILEDRGLVWVTYGF